MEATNHKDTLIRLQVDPDRLTIDDLIAIESQDASALFLRDFLSRYLIDGEGEYLEEEEAKILIGKMTLSEITGAVEQFAESVKALKEKALPNASGGE